MVAHCYHSDFNKKCQSINVKKVKIKNKYNFKIKMNKNSFKK